MPRPDFKYIVHPGTVANDTVMVTFEQLCELYKVPDGKAVLYEDGMTESEYDIDLYPREDGIYESV